MDDAICCSGTITRLDIGNAQAVLGRSACLMRQIRRGKAAFAGVQPKFTQGTAEVMVLRERHAFARFCQATRERDARLSTANDQYVVVHSDQV